MFRYALYAGLLLATAWISLTYLTKVGAADVIAYKKYERPAGPGHAEFLPGDVVLLYDDGAMERLCDLQGDIPEDAQAWNSTYVNSLGQSIPFVQSVFVAVRDLIGPKSGEEVAAVVAAGSYRFNGLEQALGEVSSAGLPDDCACRIARWSNRGTRACTVNAALVETRIVQAEGVPPQTLNRTVAVTLARHTNFLMDAQYEACGLTPNDQSRIVQQRLCNEGGEEAFPLDVRVRRRLNLIEELPQSSIPAFPAIYAAPAQAK